MSMKTEAIKQQIIANYRELSKLAHVKQTKENVLPIWGIAYKKGCTFGFVSQIGMIERNNSAIRIAEEGEIQLQRKTLFSTWKRTLKNINTMLQTIISNIDNQDVVKKRVLDVRYFPKGTLERVLPSVLTIKVEDGQVVVERPNDEKQT